MRFGLNTGKIYVSVYSSKLINQITCLGIICLCSHLLHKLLRSNSDQTSSGLYFLKPGVFKRITRAPQRIEGEHTALSESVRRGEGVDARIFHWIIQYLDLQSLLSYELVLKAFHVLKTKQNITTSNNSELRNGMKALNDLCFFSVS